MQETRGKKTPRMVREQLMLTPEQNAHLKRIATATSKSEGELVREVIDHWLAKQAADVEDWKAAWRQAAGMWADRTDIDELMAERRAADAATG
jgi:predicted DNA-binding protein